jgi:hypothetical protein
MTGHVSRFSGSEFPGAVFRTTVTELSRVNNDLDRHLGSPLPNPALDFLFLKPHRLFHSIGVRRKAEQEYKGASHVQT